jgi:hypothetical protein
MKLKKYLLIVNSRGKLIINGRSIRCPLKKIISESEINQIEVSLRSQRITDYTLEEEKEEENS